MKNSYKGNRDYYPDLSRQFNSSTRSLAQRKYNISSSQVSQKQSKLSNRIQNRLQKACPTNSIQAYKKQVTLLKKQLQRIQKQNLKKDNRIFQMESNYSLFKQLQSELQQTYRIIYMYEGKIGELEKQLKRLQHKISVNLESTLDATQIQSLLNQYRDDNTQMRSTIQGQNRIIMELQQKLKNVQSKYFHTSWKLNTQNRIIANPLKKKFPKLRDTIVIQEMSLSERQKMMNQMANKYQTINKQKQLQKQKSQQNIKIKGYASQSKQKIKLNGYQTQQAKESRMTAVLQTPKSIRISNVNISKQSNQQSQNYTVQKSQTTPKLYTGSYKQEWQKNKQGINNNYQPYRINQTRKSNLTSQSQPLSLTYSLSQQGTNITQRSISPQSNRIQNYNLSTSQAGYHSKLLNSQSGIGSVSTSRVISNSNLISSNGKSLQSPVIYRTTQSGNIDIKNMSGNINTKTIQTRQSSSNNSPRIIRVSRQKIQPNYSQSYAQSYSQNQNGNISSYYQGSSSIGGSFGSQQMNSTSKKVRYVMKTSS